MTKDVLITISGVQMLDDDDEDVEMVTRGDYYQKNGKHYIMYDEQMEGFEGTVKNIIKVSPGSVDIIKKGIKMCIRDREFPCTCASLSPCPRVWRGAARMPPPCCSA